MEAGWDGVVELELGGRGEMCAGHQPGRRRPLTVLCCRGGCKTMREVSIGCFAREVEHACGIILCVGFRS